MIGLTISHYRILEKLGQGGMGVVYKAHDTRLDRDVALKFLPATLNASADEIARFEQEARAISALNHPNIATIYDFDEADGNKFLALEFIAGGTLKSKIKKLKSEDKELSIDEVTACGIQIAEGLAHAHRHEIIHRDIKSDNIMLAEDGNVKITDFGLAKLRGATQLTRTGSTVGTLAYMAPEQLRGEEIDHRADLFSLGVVLYEMATTHLPFRGEHEAALTYSIANEDPVPAKSLRKDLPPPLEQVIMKALQKDPALRYQNADGIVSDLRKFQQESAGTVKTLTAKKRSKLPWIIAAAIVVALAAGYVFLMPSHPTGTNSKTIAVLPFSNLMDNKEEEYFSDGITDDILTQLAQISDLNVISRTSVMQYKGTSKTIREIGKELNAGVILEGSVRRAGDQIRIVAQLIDANNDKHLWAATYDREYKQVFAIQSEIARNISNALQARLSPTETEKLGASANGNTETYNLLLEGRYFFNRQDSTSLEKAIELYHRGLAIDSTDARLWAGLANASLTISNYIAVNNTAVIARARNAAQRAIDLNDNLAEGHVALGFILHAYDWDWQNADREFKKALTLEPGSAIAIRRMSGLAGTLGRFDEAIALCRKSIDLDPVAISGYQNLAILYEYVGRWPEAVDLFRRVLEMNPQYDGANQMLGTLALLQGNIDSAIIITEREHTQMWRLFGQAIVYHAAGRKKDADAALAKLIAMYPTTAPYQVASVYAYRNESDRAFEWLEKAYKLRDAGISQIKGDPLLKNIEHDPRMVVFLAKVKLAD